MWLWWWNLLWFPAKVSAALMWLFKRWAFGTSVPETCQILGRQVLSVWAWTFMFLRQSNLVWTSVLRPFLQLESRLVDNVEIAQKKCAQIFLFSGLCDLGQLREITHWPQHLFFLLSPLLVIPSFSWAQAYFAISSRASYEIFHSSENWCGLMGGAWRQPLEESLKLLDLSLLFL